MKNNKAIIISIIVIILLAISSVVYYVYTKEDSDTTLNLIDKKWIESNKNKVFDISVINNIPIFNYKGDGIFFDFINDIESDTELDFNPISYNYSEEVPSEYSFGIKKELAENDILIYEDNYVLVSNNSNKYDYLDDVKNINIGVLNDDLEYVNEYINTSVTFQTFNTIDKLFAAITSEDKTVDAISIPRTVYLDRVIANANLNIVYNISDLKEYYVLTLGSEEKLNTIITKYLNNWLDKNYDALYKEHLNENYFSFKKVDETSKAKFKGKTYIYGFVNNPPYDLLYDSKLFGLNIDVIKGFTDLAGIDLTIEKYSSDDSLITAFNENKVDFLFNTVKDTDYAMDTYKTTSTANERLVIVSSITNNMTVNSINSIKEKEIMVVENSKISSMLESNGNKIKTYSNMSDLLENVKKDSIIAMDYYTYYYYNKTKLCGYKIDYLFKLNDEYQYLMRDISDNIVFNEYFNFYLSFINEREFNNNTFVKILSLKEEKPINLFVLISCILIFILLVLIVFLKKILFKKRRNKKNVSMSKADKLKYIDVLTSLKNRNYLNDHIEIWDDSNVYPQAIVIFDLNNVAYINDNYGHQEGDNVIKEAANILIKNQITNTDIIRTSGNEFLVYMVGYDEKQIASYIKKVMKELKELPHGFGAAAGYSITTDAIKTVDDAVNEATIDMRNNKEESSTN
ncbi:MAG: GGDEF domain-containing protein [Bacilli bacterium]|nr:GGDEF domain-containing protein [Bacilli bacterium]